MSIRLPGEKCQIGSLKEESEGQDRSEAGDINFTVIDV